MLIYKVVNNLNGKVYIGKTAQSLVKRKSAHYVSMKSGSQTNFHNALRKHSKDNFTWVVVAECDNIVELNALEIRFINEYDSYRNGYNMTEGGDGGFTYKRGDILYDRIKPKLGKWKNGNPGATKSAIEKRIESFKNATWPTGMNHKNYGHKHNAGILIGDKNPMYGKVPTNARKVQINGVTYESIASASKELNVSEYTIRKRCLNDTIINYKYIN